MGQLGLFTRAELAEMRDRTKSRRYSPEKEAFRREHERRRAWGLIQRHSRKLRDLHGGDGIVALTAAMLGRATPACAPPAPQKAIPPNQPSASAHKQALSPLAEQPTEPVPAEPLPTDEPCPAEPLLTEPLATEPPPAESLRTAELRPTEPSPTEPPPAESRPTAEPRPTEPNPTEPPPAESRPTAEPRPTEPPPAEPHPAEPNPAEPLPTGHGGENAERRQPTKAGPTATRAPIRRPARHFDLGVSRCGADTQTNTTTRRRQPIFFALWIRHSGRHPP